jgi:hypothetical protein
MQGSAVLLCCFVVVAVVVVKGRSKTPHSLDKKKRSSYYE